MSLTPQQEWAAQTAVRLHVWQECLFEDDPDIRGAEVWNYIAAALEELQPYNQESRATFLRALDDAFPFYQERKAVPAEVVPGIGEKNGQSDPGTKEREELTALEHAEVLVQKAEKLSGEEKALLAAKLAKAGILLPAPRAETSANSTEALPRLLLPVFEDETARLNSMVERIQTTLGETHFEEKSALSLVRSFQMLGLMSEHFLLLHPKIWSMWERIVSSHHYTTSFNRPALAPEMSLAHFLQGETSARRKDVGLMVAKTFYLTQALIAAVEAAGIEFSEWFFEKFGPLNIESVVKYEAGEEEPEAVDFWRRYQHLAESHTAKEMGEQFVNLLGRQMLQQIQKMTSK